MANGRNARARRDENRDGGGFVALPWEVLDCPNYSRLSHPGRSLLLEFARQLGRPNNNGRLLATADRLRQRGWKSSDVIARAKRELLDAGFIFETVMGGRPNKASWYAVTWYALAHDKRYDYGVDVTFRRGLYRRAGPSENAPLSPSGGARLAAIAPADGAAAAPVAPSGGAMGGILTPVLHRLTETI